MDCLERKNLLELCLTHKKVHQNSLKFGFISEQFLAVRCEHRDLADSPYVGSVFNTN